MIDFRLRRNSPGVIAVSIGRLHTFAMSSKILELTVSLLELIRHNLWSDRMLILGHVQYAGAAS